MNSDRAINLAWILNRDPLRKTGRRTGQVPTQAITRVICSSSNTLHQHKKCSWGQEIPAVAGKLAAKQAEECQKIEQQQEKRHRQKARMNASKAPKTADGTAARAAESADGAQTCATGAADAISPQPPRASQRRYSNRLQSLEKVEAGKNFLFNRLLLDAY